MNPRFSLCTRLMFIRLFMCGVTSVMPAAEFSAALNAQMELAQASDLVSAIVILPSPVDIRALDLKLHDERADLARRHKEIIAALHYNAETTQPAFCAELDAAHEAGAVSGYTTYWIENIVVVQATKTYLESLRSRGDIAFVAENFRVELTEPNAVGVPDARRTRHPLDNLVLNRGIVAAGAYRVNV